MDLSTEEGIKEYLGVELYNKLSSKAEFGVVFLFQHYGYNDILDLVDDLSFEECQVVDLICEEFEDYVSVNKVLYSVPSCSYISCSIENGKYIVRYAMERSNYIREKSYDDIDSCIHKLKYLTGKF